MKKYFYTDGQSQFGPFTFEELEKENLTGNTMVWYNGLSDWTQAKDIPELESLFRIPPIPPGPGRPIPTQPPKTWLVESILVTLFCCLPFGIAGIVNASKVESAYRAGDLEGALQASEKAKSWVMTSFWIGIVIGFIYVLIGISGGL